MISVLIVVLCIFVLHIIYEYFKRKPFLDEINQKYILITGCDTGFGNELARKLDRRGCHVFAACYSEKGQQELSKECSSRLQTLHLDVTKEENVKEALKFVSDKLPASTGLWGLVNNAGIKASNGTIPLEFSSKQDFQGVLDVNLLGMIDMTLTFLPLIKKTKGRIINMASVAGRTSVPLNVPYPISKYGVEAFSDSLRMNVHQYGIKVSILEPGFFPTSMTSRGSTRAQCEQGYARLTEEQKKIVNPEYIEKSVEFSGAFYDAAPKSLDMVVDAYIHGLLAVHPKIRYTCGWDSYLIMIPISYTPSWLQDIVGRYFFNKFRKLYNINSPD